VSGIELIAYERLRQVEAEGYSTKHDDAHVDGALLSAAMCYAGIEWLIAGGAPVTRSETPMNWPWSADAWKPTNDPVRNLVKAGALLAAEIDRLLRLNAEAERSGQNEDISHA